MKKNTAQKIKSSTQKFTEIEEVKEDIILISGGHACLIVEIQATNFSLLSTSEQHAKLSAYASLLNSLSFPVQIVIRNKKVDVSSYLKLLDSEMQKLRVGSQTAQAIPGQAEKRIDYIQKYRIFVEDLIKVNTVLNKAFYMIVSYSFLEKGITGVNVKKNDFFDQAKAALHTKAESLLSQLSRIGLKSKILTEDSLIKLFYDIYNQEETPVSNLADSASANVVKSTA